MRPLTSVFLVLVIAAGACTGSDDAADQTTTSSTTGTTLELPTLPATRPVVTEVIQQGLPDGVEVPGEQLEFEGRIGQGSDLGRELRIVLPDDFTSRNDLQLCARKPTSGWARCRSTMQGGAEVPIPLPAGNEPSDIYLILGRPGDDIPKALRRLAIFEFSDPGETLRLQPAYGNLADVMTKQPDADGNYLAVVR